MPFTGGKTTIMYEVLEKNILQELILSYKKLFRLENLKI